MASTMTEIELQLADDDSISTYVDVEYEVVRAQTDCGIMNDYIEISEVKLPSDYTGLEFPESQINDPIFICDLEVQLKEEGCCA